MKNNNAKLIIFTGPSGVGKGTILKEFFNCANNFGDRIIYSVSNTTRSPREGEIEGVHYFFTKKEDFEKLIEQNAFLEWASYSGNYYGTNKNFVEENLKKGYSVLLEIELQGALQVMKKCPDAVSIFIAPPSFEELEKRLRGRHSETDEAINKRLAAAKAELGNMNKFDYVIENDEVQTATKKLLEVFHKEIKK